MSFYPSLTPDSAAMKFLKMGLLDKQLLRGICIIIL